MTREDFIKGVKEGTIADYEMIRYCEENILPYAKSDEERKNFLNDIIGSLLVEYITSKDTNDKRLWNAYNLINDHYENPIGDPCYGKVIGWQDGHIVLKEKDQQTEQEPQQKLIDLLPEQLQSDEAVMAFNKALSLGWMEKTTTGFHWKRTKVELAYFCKKIYCPTNTEVFPDTALNKLFGENRLQSSLTKMIDAKKEQKWKSTIDEIFN